MILRGLLSCQYSGHRGVRMQALPRGHSAYSASGLQAGAGECVTIYVVPSEQLEPPRA